MYILYRMSFNIENICYEYTDECMFSHAVDMDGLPLKIILHIENKYIPTVSKILFNYGYHSASIKRKGKYYSIVHFGLTSFIASEDSDNSFFEDFNF